MTEKKTNVDAECASGKTPTTKTVNPENYIANKVMKLFKRACDTALDVQIHRLEKNGRMKEVPAPVYDIKERLPDIDEAVDIIYGDCFLPSDDVLQVRTKNHTYRIAAIAIRSKAWTISLRERADSKSGAEKKKALWGESAIKIPSIWKLKCRVTEMAKKVGPPPEVANCDAFEIIDVLPNAISAINSEAQGQKMYCKLSIKEKTRAKLRRIWQEFKAKGYDLSQNEMSEILNYAVRVRLLQKGRYNEYIFEAQSISTLVL